jgi:hypothetical protein
VEKEKIYRRDAERADIGRLFINRNILFSAFFALFLRKLGLRCFTPPVFSPSREDQIKAFPLDGERALP